MSSRSEKDRYPTRFEPNTSHANAVALLDGARVERGVVLDLGCGNAPAAEPLAERGFEYVGVDVDKRALDGLVARGFETHRVDLTLSRGRLAKRLREVIGDRAVAAILALDVLEHLVDPRAVVEVLAEIGREHTGCTLVVSIPNVTHRDVAVRLLLGQWETTEVGLLDDTHLRFFSPAGVDELFAGSGWRPVDAMDTTAEHTEQAALLRTPALQPDAPLADFLRRVREMADPHGVTYQFVRRFVVDATSTAGEDTAAPAEGIAAQPFLTVAILGDAESAAPLLADLERQTERDFTTHVLGAGATLDDVNALAERLDSRYLCVLDAHDRAGPGLVAAFVRGASNIDDDLLATDCVVRVDAVALDADELGSGADFHALVADRVPIEPDGFDLLRADVLGSTALAAYAVPASAVRTLGLRFEPERGPVAPAVFLARAVELCGIRGVGAVELAVDRAQVRSGTDDIEGVRDALGSRSFLLAPGGVARLAAQRRTLSESIASERALRAELEALRPRLVEAEEERDRLAAEREELESSKSWKAVLILRRVAALARRVLSWRPRR